MMKLSLPAKTVLCAAVCFAIINSSAYAKTMYKWVDANGKVSFSDQVPPTKAGLGHQELDKNANVVKVAEKAKTKEELEMEKRLILLRKQQEKIIIQQKAHDKKLVSSFLNITAMDTTQKSKMQALAGQEQEMQTNIKQLEQELADLHKQAANFEIKNTKVPQDVLNQIEENQKKTAKTKETLKQLQLKKTDAEKEFAVDRARYLFLTQSAKASGANAKDSTADKSAPQINQPGLFSCDNAAQCEKAWPIAKEFVKNNSAAKITVDSETLFMSEDPVSDTDLNLSISKMAAEGNKTEIFLDIRCTNTVAATALCASSKAEEIRVRFNDYIKVKLNEPATSSPAPATKPAPAATPAAPAPVPATK